MYRFFVSLLIVFSMMSAQAAPMCSSLFKVSGVEILNEINEKYSQVFFNNKIDENIQKSSSFLLRSYKLFKLRRLLKNLEKNGDSFDKFELHSFVSKLDKLAFADAVEANLSRGEKAALSDARRSLMSEGIIKHFDLDKSKSGLLHKIMSVLSPAVSWKYWRWASSWLVMPKLVGTSLPPELAHKILLEGLDKHRTDVEKYIPAIKYRNHFNTFSKIYTVTAITALFTVVPYLTFDFYQTQMQLGKEQAQQILAPLEQSSREMATLDQMMVKELGALERYIESYKLKYGSEPSEEQLEKVRLIIRNKI